MECSTPVVLTRVRYTSSRGKLAADVHSQPKPEFAMDAVLGIRTPKAFDAAIFGFIDETAIEKFQIVTGLFVDPGSRYASSRLSLNRAWCYVSSHLNVQDHKHRQLPRKTEHVRNQAHADMSGERYLRP